MTFAISSLALALVSAQSTEVVSQPRADKNSQIAHQQMVAKAKSGRIDLYFLGDSITRRWGTSDKLWAESYANWKKNFWGWNAGNFGWGADSAQNILWRIENGELEGVNPKVIVLLAGTNNIGAGQSAESVARAVGAILKTCRQKAPKAKIILTGITPRNDKMEYIPVIDQTNVFLQKLADGKTIRYLNINRGLADRDGRLFPGMTIDNLHLSPKGYQVWADALKPILTSLLGKPKSTDLAPPPTSDPSQTSPPK